MALVYSALFSSQNGLITRDLSVFKSEVLAVENIIVLVSPVSGSSHSSHVVAVVLMQPIL